MNSSGAAEVARWDPVIADIAHFAVEGDIATEALDAAGWVLLDSIACATLAYRDAAFLDHTSRLRANSRDWRPLQPLGSAGRERPVDAAYVLTAGIRWQDFNDTWLAAEWGHPSDNIGAIVATAEAVRSQDRNLRLRSILRAVAVAHEIQGVLAIDNAFNAVGLDHVILVRVASAAVSTALLGGSTSTVARSVSNAFADGAPLRVYRHGANTGPRKSWAAADAAARGVWHSLAAIAGEPGYPLVLSEPIWGFQDALLRGQAVTLARPFASYVVENVLFKVPYPTEFHAQTSLEAAVRLHSDFKGRLEEVERIEIRTHQAAVRIIDKVGPLRNPADRDHCLQYIVAIGLLKGDLQVEDYSDSAASDPRIDGLRAKMIVREAPEYTTAYRNPLDRAVASSVQVHYLDGTASQLVEVAYPLGHPRRRDEARPALIEKFRRCTEGRVSPSGIERLFRVLTEGAVHAEMPWSEVVNVC